MTTRIGEETIARIERAWDSLIGAVSDGSNIGEACRAAGVTRDQVRVYRIARPERHLSCPALQLGLAAAAVFERR